MRLNSPTIPLQVISASSLSKFVTCPESWRRRYLQKERDSFGLARFMGTVDHETIAYMFGRKMEGKVLTEEELEQSYLNIWNHEMEKADNPVFGEAERMETYNKGLQMIQLYRETVAERVEPVAVEQKYEETIRGIPMPLIGYLDLETSYSIIERKTAATKLRKPKETWRFQGRIYQLFKDKPIEWQITTKQKTPQIVTGMDEDELWMMPQNKDETVAMIKRTYDQISYLYRRYGADEPWPTNGVLHPWMCGYCKHGPDEQNDCIAWRR